VIVVGQTTLETLAELSIGLIGFAGVVSALGNSRLHIEVRAFRIRALPFYSAIALLGSLLPVVANSFEIEPSTVSFVSTIALILAISSIMIWFFRGVRVLTREGNLPVMLAGVLGTIGALVVMLLISGLLFFSNFSLFNLPGRAFLGISGGCLSLLHARIVYSNTWRR